MAYPRTDCTFAFLVDAATGIRGKTCAYSKGKFHAILYATKQLVKHEKNHSPFLLEMQGAVWGMEYLREKR